MTAEQTDPTRLLSVEQFMEGLRHLKRQSKLSYRQLEQRTEKAGRCLPRSTIAQALGGDNLPRREVVEVFVRACLDSESAVLETERWLAVYDRLTQFPERTPNGLSEERFSVPAVPQGGPYRENGTRGSEPVHIRDAAEFMAALRRLKQRSGFSYRQLERRAEAAGELLPRSTAAQALRSDVLPRREVVEAFVRACLGPEQTVAETAQWLVAYDRLTGNGTPPAPAPASTIVMVDAGPARLRPPARPVHKRARLRSAVALLAVVMLLLGGSIAPHPSTADPSTADPSSADPSSAAVAPVAWWRFDDSGARSVADSSGRSPLTLTGRSRRIAVPGGKALLLDGTGHATAPSAVIRTDQGFAVTARVRLDAADDWGTVLSLHHHAYDVFLLSYDPDKGRWGILVPDQTTGWAEGDETVYSRLPSAVGAWTHLAAVYDAAAGQLRLYVDGELSATRDCDPLVRAKGPLELGRALERGRPLDQWRGALDDVRVFAHPLDRLQVRGVFHDRT